jgi:FkbM family methyltransferase
MPSELDTLIEAFDEVMHAQGPVDPGRPLNPIDAVGAYRLLLGRNPGAAELTSFLGSSLTLREFLSTLVASREFSRSGGIFPPDRRLLAEVEGFRFWFNSSDREMGVPMALGRYEPHSVALLKRLVRPGMRCLDAGAQTGFFTGLLATLVGPDGAVDAFEPMPDSFDVLTRNVAENGWRHVRAHNVAVSNAPGTLEMSRVSGMYVAGRVDGADRVAVPAARIDDLIAGPIDLIKIDIEGHEPAAVHGMRAVIERSRPIIISECNEYWLRSCSGLTSADYVRLLQSFDYTLFDARDLQRALRADAVRLDGLDTIDIVAIPKGTSL